MFLTIASIMWKEKKKNKKLKNNRNGCFEEKEVMITAFFLLCSPDATTSKIKRQVKTNHLNFVRHRKVQAYIQ